MSLAISSWSVSVMPAARTYEPNIHFPDRLTFLVPLSHITGPNHGSNL